MYIKTVSIVGVGGISNLNISFNSQMNFICGPNGIGKTTVLESIAHLFSLGGATIIKRNSRVLSAEVKGIVVNDGVERQALINFDTFQPEKSFDYYNAFHDLATKIIVLKTNRTFEYRSLNSVGRDIVTDMHKSAQDAKSGIQITDVKNWFVNRYLYSAHDNSLSQEQMKNFQFAKTCFTLLNSNVVFSKVDAASNDIMVKTPSGEVYYEYLSSGYKSILSIILGIIKEIEYRFADRRIEAALFDGIIIIDELELHLHPEWQEKVANILRNAFPNAQFICTTHSPHIIQFAEANQIIALQLNGDSVEVRDLPATEFGFQGWTIEEILTDVMGMEDTRTSVFNSYIENFGKEVDSENYQEANKIYQQLSLMLHPRSELRKVLSFQLSAIKD